ncbi:ABC transporter permease [Enterovirga sp.]|uniref:ABC transporter permease n=1 Tax=Enterovirga sp. TaxID=2026350 RepID=UPI002C770D8F|nr:ABC transporter permease [Enterovirga sp.]HMO29417.1 ABC transporter permease [Enterovirga sp.]
MALTKSRDPALVVQIRVFKALILRDIRTRFFGNGLGYIIAILWPLTHIVVLLLIFFFAGRTAPFGDSLLLFFATALIPALGFRYMSRFVPMSVLNNRPLTAFPIVKYMDVILARCILEAAAFCCVAALLAAILFFLGEPIQPEYPIGAAQAFLATLLLGLGVGAFIGVIAIKLPGIMLPLILIHVIMYVTSGVLFIPSALPQQAAAVVSWNPVLHAVEWMRESYYLGYQSTVLDKEYLIGCGLGFFFAALLMEKVFRSFLTRH